MRFLSRPVLLTAFCLTLSLGQLGFSLPALSREKATPDFISIDLKQAFGKAQGTFVLLDQNENQYYIYNLSRAQEALSPCSTFKIPNSLISLETHAVRSKQTVKWDKTKNPPQDYWTPE